MKKAFPTGTTKRSGDNGSLLSIPEADNGMDLRDYFAAKAMHVFLTATMGQTVNRSNVSENAYIMADAMMKARE